MGEAEGDRSAFISRIGTFFLLLGILLVILFIASDVSRADKGRQANATQNYIAQGVQALQTRDAGAILAQQKGLPTPTLALPTNGNGNPLNYLPFFCLGTLVLVLGLFMKRKFAPPPSAGKRSPSRPQRSQTRNTTTSGSSFRRTDRNGRPPSVLARSSTGIHATRRTPTAPCRQGT